MTSREEGLSFSIEREEETSALGARIASVLAPGDLIILSGQLGAGKTFLAGSIVHALGYPEEEAVPSPTYSLLIEYPTEPPLAHADLYRLGDASELELLGIVELRRRGFVLLVEWGELYREELGHDGVSILLSANPRAATLLPRGPRGSAILAALASLSG